MKGKIFHTEFQCSKPLASKMETRKVLPGRLSAAYYFHFQKEKNNKKGCWFCEKKVFIDPRGPCNRKPTKQKRHFPKRQITSPLSAKNFKHTD